MRKYLFILLLGVVVLASNKVFAQDPANYTSIYDFISKPSTEASPLNFDAKTSWKKQDGSTPNQPPNQSAKVVIPDDSYMILNVDHTTSDIFHVFGTLDISNKLTIGNSSTDGYGFPRFIVWPGGTVIVGQNAVLKNNSQAAVQGSMIINGSLDVGGGAGTKLILTGELQVDGDITGDGTTSIVSSDADCSGSLFLGGTFDPNDVMIDDCLLKIEWTGANGTNWNDPGNWKIRIPNGNFNVTIPSVPSGVATNFPVIRNNNPGDWWYVKDLIIEDGASVTVDNYRKLKIERNLIIKPTGILIENESSTFLRVAGDVHFEASGDNTGQLVAKGWHLVVGTVYYDRNIPSANWHYVSSPLTSGIAGQIYTESVVDNWVDLGKPEAYTGWSAGTSSLGGGVALDGTASLSLSGELNYNDVNYPVTKTTTAAGDTYDGWNLVGNPFPCGIDWSVVAGSSTNISGAASFLIDGAYEAFVATVTSFPVSMPAIYIASGSGNIPANQGFFVQASSNGMVTFPKSAKVSHNAALYKKRGVSPDYVYNVFKLKIEANNKSNTAAIRLFEYATENFDFKMDARKRYPNTNGKPELFVITPDDTELTVSTVPETNGSTESRLGYAINISSNCTISLSDFVSGTVVILKDKLLNTETNLAVENYEFSTVKGKFTNRFELIITPPVIWRGKVSDNWEDAQNWDKRVPLSTDNVIIPPGKLPLVNNTAVCKNLYIEAGSNLTVNGTLEVSDQLVLLAEKDRRSSLKNNGVLNVGEYVVEKYVESNTSNFLASPLDGSFKGTGANDIALSYNEAQHQWTNADMATVANGEAWKFTTDKAATVCFSGSNGSDSEGFDLSVQSVDMQTKGVNLIGNPFTAAVDLAKFIERNNDVIDGTVYRYSQQQNDDLSFDDYTYSNSIGVVGFGKYSTAKAHLPIGEAVFVKALTEGEVVFEKDMQLGINEIRPANEVEATKSIRLSITSPATQFNETLLAFNAQASDGYDNGMDAAKITENNTLSLYSTDNSGLKLAIQAVNENSIFSKNINIGYTAVQSGTHILNVTALNKFETNGIYLKDNVSGEQLNLKEINKYEFNTEAGTFDNRFELIFTETNKWIATSSKLWEDAANWEKGIPTTNQTVTIPEGAVVVLNGIANCYELIIGGNASLKIMPAGQLNVQEELVLKAADKTASLSNNGIVNTDKMIVELNKNNDIRSFVAVPLGNAEVEGFNKQWFFRADERALSSDLLSNQHQLLIGEGYRHEFMFKNNTIRLAGNLRRGIVERNVSYTENAQAGLNLIGNPYTAEIDAEAFFAANLLSPIEKTIIRWKSIDAPDFSFSGYTYASAIGSVGAGSHYQPDNTIAVGEGFFVRASDNGKVVFDEAMQIDNQSNKRSAQELSSIKIAVSNSYNQYNETLLAFVADATNEHDIQYDARKVEDERPALGLYTHDGNVNYAINAKPSLAYYDDRSVKIGVNANLAGTYRLNLTDINVNDNVSILLIDNLLELTTDLRLNPTYEFDVSVTGRIDDRFELKLNAVSPEQAQWTGAVSNEWENPENWDTNLPGINTKVVILPSDNNPVLSTEQYCKEIIVMPNALVEITEGSKLNVLSDIVIKTAAQGNGILLNRGEVAVNGVARFERYIDAGRRKFISVPLSSVDKQDFGGEDIRYYNTENGNWSMVNENTAIVAGQAVVLPSQQSAVTIDFEGAINTGDVVVNLMSGTTGFNLIGNPFLSPINWNNLSIDEYKMGRAIYRWDDDLNNFRVNVNGIGNTGTGFDLSEGFMVHVVENTTITFNNDVKTEVVDNSVENNMVLAIQTAKVGAPFVLADEAFLHLSTTASPNFDGSEEAYKLFSADSNDGRIYFKSGSDAYAIMGIESNNMPTKVMLGFIGQEGINYTIKADDISFAPTTLLLEDKKTQTIVDLLSGEYQFGALADDSDRFALHFNDNILAVNKIELEQLNVYTHDKEIYIGSENITTDRISVKIYDITGRKLYEETLNANSMNIIKPIVSPGLYMVNVRTEKAVHTKKVMIE